MATVHGDNPNTDSKPIPQLSSFSPPPELDFSSLFQPDSEGFTPVRSKKSSRTPRPTKFNGDFSFQNFPSLPTSARSSKAETNIQGISSRSESPSILHAELPKKGTSTQEPKSWSEVLKGLKVSFSAPLTYYDPVNFNDLKCAFISSELTNTARQKWENCIILYVIGNKPYYPYFRDYITRVWKPLGDFKIFSKENGFYLIKFDNSQDCERVLDNGPYYYDRRLIIMRKWTPEIKMSREFLKSVPVWIKLLNLPLDFWTTEAISRISSLIGKPLKMDHITESMIRIAYARVLVEISSDFPFPNKVPVLLPNNHIVWQEVEYEWLPPKCQNCLCFGHSSKNCSMTKVWVPKNSVADSMDMENTNTSYHAPVDTIINKQIYPKDLERESANTDSTMHIDKCGTYEGANSVQNVSKESDIKKSSQIPNQPAENAGLSEAILTSQNVKIGDITTANKENDFIMGGTQDSDNTNVSQEDLLLEMNKDRNYRQETNNKENGKKGLTRRNRSDENLLQFEADKCKLVIDNPQWANLVNQLKNKSRKSKKSKALKELYEQNKS